MGGLVLITGGAGFIGSSLAEALLSEGKRVRIMDNFSPQIHSNQSLPDCLQDRVQLIKADVRDREALRGALIGVTELVHLAAETGTGQSMYEIEKYFSVNVQGTAALIDLLQNDGCGSEIRSIIVASSRAVYGEGAYLCPEHNLVFPGQRNPVEMIKGDFEPHCPYCGAGLQLGKTSENAPFQPMSFYGLTKQVQEQAILLYAQVRGINAFALRYQNVYGPGQSLKNPYTGILAVFSNLARQNQDIEIYEDGNESRDFVYIDDVVEATCRSINFSGKFIGPLNVGSDHAVSVINVAQEIKKYFGSSSAIRITGAFRAGDIRHNLADISNLEKILEYVPRTSFKIGLANFLEWAAGQKVGDKEAYLRSVNELSSHGLMGCKAKIA